MKPSTGGDVAAFFASVALHAGLVAAPIVAGLYVHAPPTPLDTRPNNVAMVGNSIEVEAPTSELVAAPVAPESGPVEVNTTLAPAPAALAPKSTTSPDPHSKPDAASLAGPFRPSPRLQAPPPRVAAPRSATAAAGSEAPTTGTRSAGTFGQEGLAPGVRRLGYAFTRAIPAATPADETWRELPAGHVGTIRIELQVDDRNQLGEPKRWQARPGEPAPPAVLERMVQRTLLLLRAGQFALSGSNQPGSERLSIDVTLRDEGPDDEASTNVVSKGFDGASPGHPGRAHFRYGTGRTFEAKVTVVASGR